MEGEEVSDDEFELEPDPSLVVDRGSEPGLINGTDVDVGSETEPEGSVRWGW